MASNLAGMAFIPYYNHIMKLLDTDPELRKTAKGIFTQMSYAAGGAAVGGVVAGPPGAMLGGIVGSVVGYMRVEDYDSLVSVLKGLTEEQKKELVKRIQECVGASSIEALTSFIAQQVNREVFMNIVREFANHASKGA